MGSYAEQAIESGIRYSGGRLSYSRSVSVKEQLNIVARKCGFSGYRGYSHLVTEFCSGYGYNSFYLLDML